MADTIYRFDVVKHMRKGHVNIIVVRSREFRFRLWLAGLLWRLGGWVANTNVTISVEFER